MLLYTLVSIIGFHTSMTLCYIQVGCDVYYAHIIPIYIYVVEYLLQINVTFSGHFQFFWLYIFCLFCSFLVSFYYNVACDAHFREYFLDFRKSQHLARRAWLFIVYLKPISLFWKFLVIFAQAHALCFIIPKGIFNI